jgi:hypothetical protein
MATADLRLAPVTEPSGRRDRSAGTRQADETLVDRRIIREVRLRSRCSQNRRWTAA